VSSSCGGLLRSLQGFHGTYGVSHDADRTGSWLEFGTQQASIVCLEKATLQVLPGRCCNAFIGGKVLQKLAEWSLAPVTVIQDENCCDLSPYIRAKCGLELGSGQRSSGSSCRGQWLD